MVPMDDDSMAVSLRQCLYDSVFTTVSLRQCLRDGVPMTTLQSYLPEYHDKQG